MQSMMRPESICAGSGTHHIDKSTRVVGAESSPCGKPELIDTVCAGQCRWVECVAVRLGSDMRQDSGNVRIHAATFPIKRFRKLAYPGIVLAEQVSLASAITGAQERVQWHIGIGADSVAEHRHDRIGNLQRMISRAANSRISARKC